MVYMVPPGKLEAMGICKKLNAEPVLTLPQLIELWVEGNQSCKVCHQYVGTSNYRVFATHISKHVGLSICLFCFRAYGSSESLFYHMDRAHNQKTTQGGPFVPFGKFFVSLEFRESFLAFARRLGMTEQQETELRRKFGELTPVRDLTNAVVRL